MAVRERRGGYEVLVYAGIDPVTGRQRYKSRQVNGSFRDAQKEEARLITEVADGRHLGTRTKTFGELLDAWLRWRERNGKPISPRTLNDYRALVEDRIKPALATRSCPRSTRPPWTRSTRGCVRAATPRPGGWLRPGRGARRWPPISTRRASPRRSPKARPTEADRRLSPSRMHDVHVIISGALGLAVRCGWLPFNVAMSVRPASGKGAARKVPTAAQVTGLFKALRDDPELASFCGSASPRDCVLARCARCAGSI